MNNLISLTTASELLGIECNILQYYKKRGRFVEATFIDGKPFYDRDDVLNWKPVYKKIGRPKHG